MALDHTINIDANAVMTELLTLFILSCKILKKKLMMHDNCGYFTILNPGFYWKEDLLIGYS